MFQYKPENGLSFPSSEHIPVAFSNLKRHLKDHVTKMTHFSNWEDWRKTEEHTHVDTKNHQIGMRIARICYSMYKEGKAERSFETEALKRIQDGLDMGDINHSYFSIQIQTFCCQGSS